MCCWFGLGVVVCALLAAVSNGLVWFGSCVNTGLEAHLFRQVVCWHHAVGTVRFRV